MGTFLTESQFRKLETATRIIFTLAIIVFVVVAWNTQSKIQEVKKQVKTGNCSYLFQQGMVTTEEGRMNYSEYLQSGGIGSMKQNRQEVKPLN